MTTDNKTLAVDVLAVMLDDAQKAKRHRMTVDAEYADDAEEESEEARAAVAELIEAVDKHLLAIRQMDEAMHDGINVQGAVSGAIGTEEMLRSALARVKGESA